LAQKVGVVYAGFNVRLIRLTAASSARAALAHG